MYLQRSQAWNEKGATRLDLPAVDLPVSRTGVNLHHSPRYAIEPKPGAFRVEADPGPWTAALRRASEVDVAGALATPPPPPPASELAARERKDLQLLVDQYKRDAGRTRQGAVPIAIDFPEIGPAVFLAAELTAEMRSPSLEIEYRKTGGR